MSRSDTSDNRSESDQDTEPGRELPAAAQRALAEADARRRMRDREARQTAKELGGTDGPDPVRYGDWENGGIASDF